MMPTPAYVDHILETPHPDPFPPEVLAIAMSGYAASVVDHPQPGRWSDLDSTQQHRWLRAADFVWSYPGPVDAAGVRAVRYAGYAEIPWDVLGPKSRIRWQNVTAAMLTVKARLVLVGKTGGSEVAR